MKKTKKKIDIKVKVPVYICNNKSIIELNPDTEEVYNIKSSNIPPSEIYPKRWSPNFISKFLSGESETLNLKELYLEVLELYKKYLYFDDDIWYHIHTLWDIGTYFFLLFDCYPIFVLRGLSETGKTKIMTLSRQFTFNATEEMTNPSESVLFRITEDLQPTKYIDEAESFFTTAKGKHEPDTRAELLNSGFKRTGTIAKSEKVGNT